MLLILAVFGLGESSNTELSRGVVYGVKAGCEHVISCKISVESVIVLDSVAVDKTFNGFRNVVISEDVHVKCLTVGVGIRRRELSMVLSAIKCYFTRVFFSSGILSRFSSFSFFCSCLSILTNSQLEWMHWISL